jgi:hypothetical protein
MSYHLPQLRGGSSDQVVRGTAGGEREVKIARRKTLLKYKLHRDTGLFERGQNVNPGVLLTIRARRALALEDDEHVV